MSLTEVTVQLTYFDAGGIYYGSRQYRRPAERSPTGSVSMLNAFAEVEVMIEERNLPGIGGAVGPVLVTCEEGYPRLLNLRQPTT